MGDCVTEAVALSDAGALAEYVPVCETLGDALTVGVAEGDGDCVPLGDAEREREGLLEKLGEAVAHGVGDCVLTLPDALREGDTVPVSDTVGVGLREPEPHWLAERVYVGLTVCEGDPE